MRKKLLTKFSMAWTCENAAISIETLQAKIAASNRVPRGDQDQHAARTVENGMAARCPGQDRLSDELPDGRPWFLRYSIKESRKRFHRFELL